MPKDRHKGTHIDFWLRDEPLREFDRLRNGDTHTDKEVVLKLMRIAKTNNEEEGKLRNTIKTQKTQIEKLIRDLAEKPKVEPQVIIKEVPKIEYRDRIVEVPKSIGIEKERLQKSLRSLENNLITLSKAVWGLKEIVLYFQVTQQARAERQAKTETQPSAIEQRDKPIETPALERTMIVNEKIYSKPEEAQTTMICPEGKGNVDKEACKSKCPFPWTCSAYVSLIKAGLYKST